MKHKPVTHNPISLAIRILDKTKPPLITPDGNLSPMVLTGNFYMLNIAKNERSVHPFNFLDKEKSEWLEPYVWWDNIPEKGTICKNKFGQYMLVEKYNGSVDGQPTVTCSATDTRRFTKDLTPLTHREIFDLLPEEYYPDEFLDED